MQTARLLTRGAVTALFLCAGTIGIIAGPASASGPAAPGKQIIPFDCVGLGTVTLSVTNSKAQNSFGAGQVVDTQAHLIPTSFTFTLNDLTTPAASFSGTTLKGGGNANQNQTTTTCSTIFFTGTADQFAPGQPLPPGVNATDTIQVSFGVTAVVRP